jgi:hypothetical protein
VREEAARLAAAVPTIRWLYGVNPQVARFFAGLGETHLYVQYPGSGHLPPGYDPTERDWYRDGLATDGVDITAPYRDATTQQLVISAVTSLRRDGRTIGVAGVDFDVDVLLDSRRPDVAWHDEVLVSLLRVQHDPELRVSVLLGRVPGVTEKIGRVPGREPEITARDPESREALAKALAAQPPSVLRTRDERGDWLWAFEPLPFETQGLLLTMAAPTHEVTAAADAVDDGIRVETSDQLRRAASYAGIGLLVILGLLALWTYRGMRAGLPDTPRSGPPTESSSTPPGGLAGRGPPPRPSLE